MPINPVNAPLVNQGELQRKMWMNTEDNASRENIAESDRKLRELLQGKQSEAAMAQLLAKGQQEQEAANVKAEREKGDLAALLGAHPKTSVKVGDYSVNPEPLTNPNFMRPTLTPAQEQAERTVGKQIADYQAAGGKPAIEKNLQSLTEVQNELQGGKRDGYDRAVGTVFGTMPSLLGVFGSAEKARRDKARNTALTIAKQSDPNPTEKQIETIMGQIYDPASSDEDNLSRISRFHKEQTEKANNMEQASQNYNNSGYATIGGVHKGQPQASGSMGMSAQQKARLEELRAKHKR